MLCSYENYSSEKRLKVTDSKSANLVSKVPFYFNKYTQDQFDKDIFLMLYFIWWFHKNIAVKTDFQKNIRKYRNLQ